MATVEVSHGIVRIGGDSDALKRNKTSDSRIPAIRQARDLADDYVSHLSPGEVKLMVVMAAKNPRHGERNAAIISVLFDGTLRASEALGIRPCDVGATPDGYTVKILGKGNRPGEAAITAETANKLTAYAYHEHIEESELLFPISRSQLFRVVQDSYRRAGIRRPTRATDRVGGVHVLRHSGAIARMAASGNPKSVQHQLRHKSAVMTMRYLKTVQIRESLKVQEGVNPW